MTQHANSLVITFSLGYDFRVEETDVVTQRCRLHCLVPFPPLLHLGFSVAMLCWDYVSLHTPLSSIHMKGGWRKGGDGERGGKRREESWQDREDVTLLKCLFMNLPLHSFYRENQFLTTSPYFWPSLPPVSDPSLFYLDSAPCVHAAVPAARDYPISKLSASHYLDEELASESGLV